MDGGEFLHVGPGAYPGRALCVGGRAAARGRSMAARGVAWSEGSHVVKPGLGYWQVVTAADASLQERRLSLCCQLRNPGSAQSGRPRQVPPGVEGFPTAGAGLHRC